MIRACMLVFALASAASPTHARDQLGQKSQPSQPAPSPQQSQTPQTPHTSPPSQTPPAPAVANTAQVSTFHLAIGEDNVVRLPVTTTTVKASNIAGLDKLGAEAVAAYAASFSIADSGLARGTEVDATVKFLRPQFIGLAGENGLTWRVPIEAAAPAGTSHSRIAAITFGAPRPATYAVEYQVTTKPAASAQWAVRGSADVWTVSWSDPPSARVYGLLIENQDERLSNVRLVLSTLKDGSGHALGLDRMALVRAATDGSPVQRLDVAPNTVAPVYLRIDETSGDDTFGTFDGVLRFTADGSSALKDLPLKIQATSWCRKVAGVALALVGLLVAAFVSSLLRPQLARLQIRRAAAGLRRSLSDFVDEVGRTIPANLSTAVMNQTATTLSRSISDRTLEDDILLPPAFLLPGAEPTVDPKLKERLDAVSKKTEALFVLLRAGAPRLVALLARDRDAAVRLLDELDRAAAAVKSAQEAQDKVAVIHGQIPAGKEAAVRAGRGVSVEELDFQIHALSFASWSVWLLIALAAAVAWIASDADYGTTMDLVSSFLWGFGVTTFGAGVQNLTPAAVATHLNVKLAK